MKNNETIIILTGKIQSGKTTNLESAIRNHPEADGIITPLLNGKKHIKRILTGEIHLLEADDLFPAGDIITAGRYRFRKDVFGWARKQLSLLINSEKELIIIDEIGFLELEGTGFEPKAGVLIKERIKNRKKTLLVVRDTLVERVLTYYGILQGESLIIINSNELACFFNLKDKT